MILLLKVLDNNFGSPDKLRRHNDSHRRQVPPYLQQINTIQSLEFLKK